MRSFCIIAAFLCLSMRTSAQETFVHSQVQLSRDSLSSELVQDIDLLNKEMDSLTQIISSTSMKVDSLKQALYVEVSGISSISSRIDSKIDSLRSVGASLGKLQQKADSLAAELKEVQDRFSLKVDSVKSVALQKVSNLKLPPELEEQRNKLMNDLRQKMSGMNTSLSSRIPVVNTSDLAISSQSGRLGEALSDVKLPDSKLPQLSIPKSVPNVGGTLPGIDESSIQTAAESKVSDLIGKDAIDQQIADMPLSSDMSAEGMKEEIVSQVRAAAVNHFAGHEQEIKTAMAQLEKYKTKYESVANTAEILKVKHNALKGKPFIERLRPGISMQFFNRSGEYSLDINGFLGYRVTERLCAGVGWNQRVSYTHDIKSFNQSRTIYGPRGFVEFDAWKGICPRLEGEVMRTFTDYSRSSQPLDPNYSDWVWGAFAGLKKAYRVAGRLNGYACVMTRLFNYNGQSPYPSPVSVRVGFEFALKGDKKKGLQQTIKSGEMSLRPAIRQ